MASLEEAQAIMARIGEAMSAQSAERFAALYAEDATHVFPFTHSDAGRLEGRAAIVARYGAVWGRIPARLDQLKNVVVHRVDDGETFVAEFEFDLTNTETGAMFTAATVLVMTLRDGAIVHMRDYTDDLTLARALGRL